jgi:hypothetical protein
MTHRIGLVGDLLHCRTKAPTFPRTPPPSMITTPSSPTTKPVLVIAAHSALMRSLAPKLT